MKLQCTFRSKKQYLVKLQCHPQSDPQQNKRFSLVHCQNHFTSEQLLWQLQFQLAKSGRFRFVVSTEMCINSNNTPSDSIKRTTSNTFPWTRSYISSQHFSCTQRCIARRSNRNTLMDCVVFCQLPCVLYIALPPMLHMRSTVHYAEVCSNTSQYTVRSSTV